MSIESPGISDKRWIDDLGYPVVIAGPCSAESEEQVLATAHALAQTAKVSVLRAGVWKPRTRPNSFEGQGEEALKWLWEAKQQTGLLTTVEVTLPRHIELCLMAEVDILWIGARTTVNPILITELANTLRGTDVPVLVKNPINPDLQLWIGALERFERVGVSRLAAVHRGFSTFEKGPYRNQPIWEIPLELKSQLPELPVICDPSHISGSADLVKEICVQALDYGMDGLMIESHIDPLMAKSDAKQQITPAQLAVLLEELGV